MRRRTTLLVVLYLLAVLLIVALVTGVVVVATGEGFQPEILGAVAGGTLLVVGSATVYKVAQLSGGGKVVANMLGGRLVSQGTRDQAERRLLNIVEEMAIASGVPTPQVYVLDQEEGINAFAAGYRANDAVIGVTRGSLMTFDRDELQGVIGHEFSHILNGDMRLNIRLLGVLFGITCISTAGYLILRSAGRVRSGRKNSGAGGILVVGLGLLIIGWLGTLFASLIRAAVSRQREFLADASAVQFTRNPHGIANALRKIGGFTAHGQVQNAHAAETSHMFFANALAGFSSLFATHPPLEERIRAIDVHWKAMPPEAKAPPAEAAAAAAAAPGAGAVAGLAGLAGSVTPARVTASVGQLQQGALRASQELLRELPLALTSAVRDPFGARAVALGLLLSEQRDVRERQVALLRPRVDEATAHEVAVLHPALLGLELTSRLPLLELAIPALREMSPPQYDQFRALLRALIEADARVSPFEFAAERMLRRHLDATFGHARPPRVEHRTLVPVRDEVALVLSALALLAPDPAAAFAAGAARIGPTPQVTLQSKTAVTLGAVEQALDALARTAPLAKGKLLEAAAAVAAQDGQLQPQEGELLRAIADGLDCPVPPLFARAAPVMAESG